jgi:hypothetical protein
MLANEAQVVVRTLVPRADRLMAECFPLREKINFCQQSLGSTLLMTQFAQTVHPAQQVNPLCG